MKFGVRHLVIIFNESHLKGIFVAMCKYINLNYEILEKLNHRGLTIEYFNMFLNKTVTILIEDR